MTGSASIVTTHNDFDLTISIRYQGALLSLPNVGVRKHFFLEEESSYGLADFLTGVYPDRMDARSEGPSAEIRLISVDKSRIQCVADGLALIPTAEAKKPAENTARAVIPRKGSMSK